MATPTPATARVVWRASDLRRALAAHFAPDGIDDGERALLSDLDALIEDGQDADDGRLAAIGLLNINDVTAWQQRKWRERQRDRTPRDAA